ncbi:bacteriocin immunity protein [Pseudomonas koreensis]|uniref:bacteriocin immunity protein n=1 Tax=Pseudomonas koreensis TaxID=198620 RepID=UPI001B3289E9|nr:bacteriocin immunity protein [Pseudomonas koreensis]MBP4002357.1 bacteriocin immunity protein [Pseudomonas koreensis]
MKLKPTLGDYTEPEFLALVERIWAVDMPKADHDRLINHFDRISGHPKGADLLFYHPEDDPNPNSSGSVVYYVKDWHRKQGRVAFKGQAASAAVAPAQGPRAPLDQAQIIRQRIAQTQAEVQKIIADLAVSERAAQAALADLQLRISHLRQQLSTQVLIAQRELDIRALEGSEFESRLALQRYQFWKLRVQLKRDNAQREVTYARAEKGQWQGIAQQISAVYDGYGAKLNQLNARLRQLQTEAEALLSTAQTQLVGLRDQQQLGPAQVGGQLFAPLAFVNARPAILVDSALSRTLEGPRVDLQKAIRSAVAEFTWQITSNARTDQVQYAAVLRFDFRSRAEVGRYGVCVPLAEFLPIEGTDWLSLAATLGRVNVPFRMTSGTYAVPVGTLSQGVRKIKTLFQVELAPSSVAITASGVRVRSAIWNESSQTYRFTADGATPITVSWCHPDTLEVFRPPTSIADYRLGTVRSSPVPLLETFTAPATLAYDDYVVVFPADSGLEPVYVMFRNPLEFAQEAGTTPAPIAPPETR